MDTLEKRRHSRTERLLSWLTEQERSALLNRWQHSHLNRLESREGVATFLTGVELLTRGSWETGKSLYISSMPTYLRAKILPSSVPSRGPQAPNREGF